jgi:hypothetical protein
MDQVISSFIIDLKATGIQGTQANGIARPVAVTPPRAAPQAANTWKTPVAAPDMRPVAAPRLKPGGSLSLRDNSGGISSYGYYRIYAAENKVCTTINTYTGYAWYSSHKALQDCYRLFTTEANKFILRSITDKTFIAYVRN